MKVQVIINPLGDLIVRPNPLEKRLHFRNPCKPRLKHHLASTLSLHLGF